MGLMHLWQDTRVDYFVKILTLFRLNSVHSFLFFINTLVENSRSAETYCLNNNGKALVNITDIASAILYMTNLKLGRRLFT